MMAGGDGKGQRGTMMSPLNSLITSSVSTWKETVAGLQDICTVLLASVWV